VPLLQLMLRVPVLGAVLSVMVRVPPCASDAPDDAEQLLPEIVQLTACVPQEAQDALLHEALA